MVSNQHNGLVKFEYFRPRANIVQLAGDFNDWNPEHFNLKMDKNGWWRTQLKLPTGEYRFKYLVDGRCWEADFAAYGVENDKLGGWNSVVWIK